MTGENRLLRLVAPSSVPTGARKTLVFTYDSQFRRVSKTVSDWTGSAWQLTNDLRFVYDGWNLLTELTKTNTLVRTYLWGLDLSGSWQGVGSVGGLLAVSNHQAPEGTHSAAHDGNGNIMMLFDGRDGSVSASYEYGPFAEVLRLTGAMAVVNPIRFSTKYQDHETEHMYYGHRYLGQGRWLTRDSLEESAGINLFAFVQNCPISIFDPVGLRTVTGNMTQDRDGNIEAVDYMWDLEIDKPKCSISVKININLTGVEVSEATKTYWKKSVSELWSQRFKICCSSCSSTCPNGLPIHIAIDFGPRSVNTVDVNIRNGGAMNALNWWAEATGGQVSHEVGHHLGNHDEYGVVNGRDWGNRVGKGVGQ